MVDVNPTASLNSALTGTVCSGTVFNYTPTSVVSGTTFSWSRALTTGISNTAASGTNNPAETLVNTTAAPVDVTYVYTLTSGGCSRTQNVVVTVNPTPILSSSLTPSAICNNTVFSYTPTSGTTGATFSWGRAVVSGISNAASTGTNGVSETLVNNTAAPVNVTYVYTLLANGCSNVQNVVVQVGSSPTLSSTLTPPSICSNTVFNYNPTSSTTGATFSWSRAAISNINGNLSSFGNGNPSEVLTSTASVPVDVVYKYTLSVGGCSNPATSEVVVTVNPVPANASTITGTATVCQGVSSVAYSVSAIAGATGYVWTLPFGATLITGSNTNSITVNYSNSATSGVVKVYGTNSCGNGGASPDYAVTVNPLPSAAGSITGSTMVCQGNTSVVYSISDVPYATSYIWTIPAGASFTGSSNTRTVTVNYPAATSGVISVTSHNSCGDGAASTLAVTVNPYPTLTSTQSPTAVCSNTVFSYTPAGTPSGVTFSWSRAAVTGISNGATTGTGNVNETLINTTTSSVDVTYVYTASINGCSGASTYNVVVTVKPAPTLSSSLTPPAICGNTVFAYTAISTIGGTTLTWSRAVVTGISNSTASGSGNISETLDNTTTAPVNVTYVYTLTSPLGCSNVQNVVVTVNPTPVLTSSLNPPSVCSNSLFIYTPMSSTNGATFSWTRAAIATINSNVSGSGSGNVNGTLISTSNATVSVPYIYSVSANTCSGAAPYTVVVVVNPTPSLTSGLSPPAVCSGTVFNYTPTADVVGTTFNWSRALTTGISNVAATGTNNPAETLVNTTTAPVNVTYVYTLTSGGCTRTQNVVVAVNPTPKLSSTLTTAAICNNTVFSYTPTSLTDGTSFAWNRALLSGISNLANNGANNPNEALNNTTALPVYVPYIYTLTANGCYNTQTVNALINPYPVLTSSLLPPAICSSTAVNYTPLSSTPGATFAWSRIANSNINGNATATGSGNPNEILYNSSNSPVNVTYRYTLSLGGCTNPTTFDVVIQVNPTPSLSSSLTPGPICSGSQFIYPAASATPNAIINWTRAAVSGIAQTASSGSGNPNEFLFNTSALPVNVTYVYTTTLNSCSTTQNVVVTVNPMPVLSSSLTVPVLCSGSTLNYNATSTTPGATFEWTRDVVSGIQQAAVTNGTGNVNEVLTNNTSPSSPVQVTYNYRVTGKACLNPVTYPVVVTVYPTPPTPVITPASPVSFCAGSSVTLTAPGGYSYQWSNGVTTQSIAVGIAGAYSVVITDANGCHSVPSSLVNVTSNAAATAIAGPDGSVCEGGTFIVAGAYATNYQTLLWSSTGTGSFLNNGTLAPSYVPSAVDVQNGSVVLTLTANDKVPCNGSAHDDLKLTIQPKPTANAGADNTVCYPNTFSVSGSIATYYSNPVWTHNGNGVLTNINTIHPTYHPAASDVGNTVELTLTLDGIAPCATPVNDQMLLSVGALPGNPGAISGTNPVCQGVTETYSVSALSQATGYTWAVPVGATIVSGSNTNTIEVKYSASAISGNITVYGTNGCGNGPVSTLPVVVNSVPANPGSISGNALVCQGTAGVVYFVTPVLGATSYFWTVPSGATIATGAATNSITVDFDLTASSGNVTVYAINSATNCGNGPISTKPIVVNAKPSTPVISAVGGPTTFCQGGSVALMGAPAGYNYLWTPAGVTTQVNLATASGSYSVVVSDPVTGCSSGSSNSIEVIVNPAPTPPTSVGFIKHCYLSPPASVLVPPLDARDVTTISTGTIVWFDAAVGGHEVVSPTLDTQGSITYYAEARADLTNCPSLSRTPVVLTISTNPDIPVKGPDLFTCENNPQTALTATTATAPPVGTTITWYSSSTGGLPVSPSWSTVGVRTLYAEASNGACTSNGRSEGVVLTINPAPLSPVSGGNITQCIESVPHMLTATATVPAGVSITWWTLPVGGSPVIPTVSSGVVDIKSFYAEATNDLTLCKSLARTPVSISVVALPTVPVVNPAGVTTICETSTITPLDATNAVLAAPTGFKLNWYDAAGNSVANPILSIVGTLTYYAESENLTTGCKGPRLPVTLTINPAPAAPTSFGTATKCAEAVIVPLTATATATGSTIVWYTQGGVTPIVPQDPTLSNVGTVTYVAEAKDPATGCTSLARSAPVVLTINPTPAQPTTLKAEDRICQGSSSATLTATAIATGGATVVWYNAQSGGSVVSPATLSIPGTVTYWAEAVIGTCTSPSPRITSVKLTIDPAPAAPVFSETEKKKCYDGLSMSVPVLANVAWFETSLGGDALGTLPSLTQPESKTFYAETISSTTLCRSLTRTPYKLTILTTPSDPISDGDQRVCAGATIPTLTAKATSPDGFPVKFYRNSTGGTEINPPVLNSIIIGGIDYWAEADNGICKSKNRTKVHLQIDPAPAPPTAKVPLTLCANDPQIASGTFNDRLNNSNVSSNFLVEWFDSKDAPNPIDHIPTFLELSPGKNTFWAGFKDQTTLCQSQVRTEVIVTINALPLKPISKGDVVECALKPVQLIKAEVETPTDGAKITWYTLATGGSLVASPTLNRLGTITYWAQAELGTCINPTRTKVVLTINRIAADPVLMTAGVDSLVSCEAVPIVAIDAKDLFMVIPGITYVAFNDPINGVEVPTVLDYVGNKVLYMAAKDTLTTCLSAKRITVRLIIHGAPPAPVSKGDLTACAKSPADTLNANAAIVPDPKFKLLWYDLKVGGSPRTAPPVLTLASGKLKDTITYYASYADTITGCETVAKRTAVLLTLNTATASASSNSPLSLGQTLMLKGGPELAGNTFLWTDPHGFGFSTMDVIIPNVTEFAAGMYKLTVTSQNGCIATDSVLVELDIARAEAQKPVCLGGTLYLSGYPAGMKSYAWSGPGGWTSSDQNPSRNNVTIDMTGTYKLTVTSFNNATSSDTVSVAFKALPIPIAQAVTVCPSGLLQLKASPGGMTSYTWSDENGAIIDTIQNLPPRPYPVNPAKFKLTVVDWNGCEASTTITPKVFQPVITSNSPICSGDTLRLRGEPNGMLSYSWSGPNNFNSTLQSPSLNNVTAATGTGKYILTVVDKGGCTYSNSIDVSFKPPPPPATITPNMSPICEGSTLILNGGPAGMTSYNWTGPNGFTYMGQDPQIPAVTAANAGKYTLKITTPNGCRNSFETTINVSSVNFNGTYGPYCINDSPVTMSVSPAGGTFTGPGISGTTFDPRVAGEGLHAIQYTYSPAGVSCQIVATKMIDVVSVPKVVTTNPILKSCSGTTEDLTLPKVTAGSTPGLIFTYYEKDGKTLMALPKIAKSGLYYIKGATPSGKCSDIQPVMVMQPDSLRATLTQLAALNCAGDTTGRLAVKVTMGTAPYTYLWSTIPAQVKDTAINLRSGIYTVIVTDAKLCTSNFTGEIKEPASLKLGFTVKSIQCESDANGSARLDTINGSTDVAFLNSYHYFWNNSNVESTREAVRLTAYWHPVKLVSPKGCSQKDSVFIDVLDIEPPTMVCPKDIEMTVQYITSPTPNKYKVDLGKPYALDNCQVDTLTNDAPALFRAGETIVVWTVTDQVGLMDTCHQRVFIKELPTIPQLISPNGDNVNDFFIIDGLNSADYSNSEMAIFTRSGQLVFQSSNYELPENAWDGRYKESGFSKDSLVAPGVYYYILKLGGAGGQTLKGYVYVYY